MFYRYEGRRLGQKEWLGICQALTPDHRRKIARFLKVPKWYNENPNIESESWFTQKGYDQYHERREEIIKNCNDYYYPLETRLLQVEELPNLAMVGKIQCIKLKK